MARRQVSFLITARNKGFIKALDQSARRLQRFGHKMERMGRTLTRSLTVPIVAGGAIAVKAAADYEKLRQSMDILNGSAEEGARNFERLKRFSARTPFQLQDLARAQNMLQGFGLAADDAFESLSMIGDIAAVSGGDIQGIGIAFGQAAAEGRVMTRDIRQFINQGVPMIKMLAETMGVAQSEILDLASQGQITFEILQRAFREATSEGGMFADGMEKQSKTILGLFSTLRDNVSIALGELGETIVDTLNLREVLKNLTVGVQTVTQMFVDMSEDSRREMLKIAGLFAVSGPVAIAIGKFVQMLAGLVRVANRIFPMLANIVRKNMIVVTVAFIGGVGIGQALIDIWNTLAMNGKSVFVSLAESAKRGTKDVMESLGELVKDGFGAMGDAVMDLTGLNDALATFYKNFEENTKKAKRATNELGNAVRDTSMAFIRMLRLQQQVDPTSRSAAPTSVSIPEGSLRRAKKQTNEMSESLRLALGLVPGQAGEAKEGLDEMSGALQVAMNIGDMFTQSFGQGMTNLIVQGEKFVDVLRNIGRLLASSVLQTGIRLLLTGGLSGVSGFFGSGGGLFGKIFGVSDALITSQGDVVHFHPDDDILAMKDFGNLRPAMTGSQVIRNELFLDGQTVWSNQRKVNTFKRR